LLNRYNVNDAVTLHVFRRDELLTFTFKLSRDDAPQVA